MFYSWHPTTISHYPAPYQIRQRIGMHHNVYAKNGERNPQIRADVRDLDYVKADRAVRHPRKARW